MEILLAAGIGLIIYALISRRRQANYQDTLKNETPQQRKRRQTDEHIAVILPTIDNDN